MTHLGKPREGKEEDHSGYLEQLATTEVEIKEKSAENFYHSISECSQGDQLSAQTKLPRA